MSKGGKKKRSTAGLILDVVLTLCTGGLWIDLDTDPIFKKQQLTTTYLDRDA